MSDNPQQREFMFRMGNVVVQALDRLLPAVVDPVSVDVPSEHSESGFHGATAEAFSVTACDESGTQLVTEVVEADRILRFVFGASAVGRRFELLAVWPGGDVAEPVIAAALIERPGETREVALTVLDDKRLDGASLQVRLYDGESGRTSSARTAASAEAGEAARHQRLATAATTLAEVRGDASAIRDQVSRTIGTVRDVADSVHTAWIERIRRVAAEISDRTTDPATIEDVTKLVESCDEALNRDRHGTVIGLFVPAGEEWKSNRRGYCLRVAVGTKQAPQLAPDTLKAFEEALHAVAALLRMKLGAPVNTEAPSFQELAPALPGVDEPVSGESPGLAYVLAALSRLFQSVLAGDPEWSSFRNSGAFVVSPNLAVTGRIDESGDLLALKANAFTNAKIKSALSEMPDPRQTCVLVPDFDRNDSTLEGLSKVQQQCVRGIATIEDAVHYAFPLLVQAGQLDAALIALGRKLNQQVDTGEADSFLRWLSEDRQFEAGIRYCGGDPRAFVAVTCYFAFCAGYMSKLGRAPEQWPSWVDDSVLLGGRNGTAIESATMLPFTYRLLLDTARGRSDVMTSEAVASALYTSIADLFTRERTGTRRAADARMGRRLDLDEFVPAIAPVADGRSPGHQEYLRRICVNVTQNRPVLSAFAALIDLCGQPRAAFRDIFGRRVKIAAILPKDVGTEDAVLDNVALVSAILGGAWLLKYTIPYLRRHGLRKDDYQPSLAQVFNVQNQLPTEPRYAKFWSGLRNSAENQGVVAVFMERPFHPRVLWEVLSGVNERYPAEKFLVRTAIRHFAQQSCPQVHLFWNWDLLPIVADLRADPQPGVQGTRRLRRAAVQDYSAFGRTVATGSMFTLVEASSDLLQREFLRGEWANPWLKEDGQDQISHLVRELFRKPDDGAGDAWSVSALNARTTTVYAGADLRRQVLMQRFLDPAIPVDELGLSELISMPPTSVSLVKVADLGDAAASTRALKEYLCGRGDLLTDATCNLDAFGRSSFFPLFWDPMTWRGVGWASALAYDATISVVLVHAIRQLLRLQPTEGLRVSQNEVERYIAEEYRTEVLGRMRELLRHLLSKLGHAGDHVCDECLEIQQAVERVELTSEILGRIV